MSISFLVVGGLLAGACAQEPGPTPAAGAGAGPATAAAEVTLPADTPDGRGVVNANPDGTRTVTSSSGTVRVPADPKRIVSVLGYIDFETMLTLGIKPLAAGTQGGSVASGSLLI